MPISKTPCFHINEAITEDQHYLDSAIPESMSK